MPRVRELYAVILDRFNRNDILTYASAIARQLLVSVIPLSLLAFLLLGVLGKEDVWRVQLAPAVADRTSVPTFEAIDAVIEGLISTTHVGWLVLAFLVSLWEISGSVRACTGALNRIFELKETRSAPRRWAISFALALPLELLILGAMLVAARGGGWVDLGAAQPLWTLARWLLALALLWSAVALTIRVAPDG